MTTDDKEKSKVHLGAVDRSWIAGTLLTLAIGAVTWGVKIDNRQSVHATRQDDLGKRQDEMIVVLQRLTDLVETQRSTTDQSLPRIDQRLAEIERRLDRLDDKGAKLRRPAAGQEG